jgi:hypothetical protein
MRLVFHWAKAPQSCDRSSRQRRYRKRRRQGLRSVRILLDQPDIDALIRMKLLNQPPYLRRPRSPQF